MECFIVTTYFDWQAAKDREEEEREMQVWNRSSYFGDLSNKLFVANLECDSCSEENLKSRRSLRVECSRKSVRGSKFAQGS